MNEARKTVNTHSSISMGMRAYNYGIDAICFFTVFYDR